MPRRDLSFERDRNLIILFSYGLLTVLTLTIIAGRLFVDTRSDNAPLPNGRPASPTSPEPKKAAPQKPAGDKHKLGRVAIQRAKAL